MIKKLSKKIALVSFVLVFTSILFLGCSGQNQNSSINTSAASKTSNPVIKDMIGRNIKIPSKVNKVLSVSPATTAAIYMLAPQKLAGWNSKLSPSNAQYILKQCQDLPIVGSWSGTVDINYENYISMNPDIVIDNSDDNSVTTKRQQNLGNIPVVVVHDINTVDFTPYISFLGKILGATQKADKLISFYKNVTNQVKSKVSKIPENKKVKVYYAEGPRGLQTDYDNGAMTSKTSYSNIKNNQHTQLIYLCGGVNVARGTGFNAMVDVSMEQVVVWDPEVIITSNSDFYKNVYSDKSWQNIKAVKNHRVFLTPSTPYNWFDRPPGVSSIIGIPWTAKALYPDKFKDMNLFKLVKEFYSDFYHYKLSDSEVKKFINN